MANFKNLHVASILLCLCMSVIWSPTNFCAGVVQTCVTPEVGYNSLSTLLFLITDVIPFKVQRCSNQVIDERKLRFDFEEIEFAMVPFVCFLGLFIIFLF